MLCDGYHLQCGMAPKMRSRIWGWNRGLKLQLSHFLAYRTLSKLSSWSHLSLFSFTYKMGVRLFYLLWVILQIILEHLGKASGNALKKKKIFPGVSLEAQW